MPLKQSACHENKQPACPLGNIRGGRSAKAYRCKSGCSASDWRLAGGFIAFGAGHPGGADVSEAGNATGAARKARTIRRRS